MTVWEFDQYARGRLDAHRDLLRLLAQHASWTMAPHCSESPSVARLMGESISFEGMTREQIKAHMERKVRKKRKG